VKPLLAVESSIITPGDFDPGLSGTRIRARDPSP
jgi:hypothetical protein